MKMQFFLVFLCCIISISSALLCPYEQTINCMSSLNEIYKSGIPTSEYDILKKDILLCNELVHNVTGMISKSAKQHEQENLVEDFNLLVCPFQKAVYCFLSKELRTGETFNLCREAYVDIFNSTFTTFFSEYVTYIENSHRNRSLTWKYLEFNQLYDGFIQWTKTVALSVFAILLFTAFFATIITFVERLWFGVHGTLFYIYTLLFSRRNKQNTD